ncbi:MAG: DUF885 domain-containing protein [Thaumarchaeota archaeon]|nr:DUF885 domain-containing protein [Nitrososphaerota archaeon]
MQPGASDFLGNLAKKYWDVRMSADPLFATVIGDRRFSDRLPDITPEALSQVEGKYKSILTQCHAMPADSLSVRGRLTRTALLEEVSAQLDYLSCRLGDWTVDPLQGPQIEFLNMESYQPAGTPAEANAMVSRWNGIGHFFDDHIANLRRGLGEGRVTVRDCAQKVIDEIHDLKGRPDAEWAMLRPLSANHEDWSEVERQEFRDRILLTFNESIRPGYIRYFEFLETEVLPSARLQDHPGIMHIPGGVESYSRLIRVHTSLNLAPDHLHQTGLQEVAKINKEIEVLGGRAFGTGDRKQILHRLRTDPSLYFSTRDEVAEKAATALAKARDAIKNWFGRLPRAECEVVRMEEHEEKNSTIAYYRQPAADGSRPGRYYINTSEPETRPRYEAEVLAYHESIPGHHLQIAIAQELEGIPEFRRQSGVTAFVEGWGLYTERLADEMGLYSSDLDRIGVLSYDAWRACRLVVDTGMHAKGWTRQQAIDFMFENTALAKNNIVNEVDRYITWPGQALAYKTGQLEMMRLRQESQKKLGEEFEIKKFHDSLLSNGALPLEALREVLQ